MTCTPARYCEPEHLSTAAGETDWLDQSSIGLVSLAERNVVTRETNDIRRFRTPSNVVHRRSFIIQFNRCPRASMYYSLLVLLALPRAMLAVNDTLLTSTNHSMRMRGAPNLRIQIHSIHDFSHQYSCTLVLHQVDDNRARHICANQSSCVINLKSLCAFGKQANLSECRSIEVNYTCVKRKTSAPGYTIAGCLPVICAYVRRSSPTVIEITFTRFTIIRVDTTMN